MPSTKEKKMLSPFFERGVLICLFHGIEYASVRPAYHHYGIPFSLYFNYLRQDGFIMKLSNYIQTW